MKWQAPNQLMVVVAGTRLARRLTVMATAAAAGMLMRQTPGVALRIVAMLVGAFMSLVAVAASKQPPHPYCLLHGRGRNPGGRPHARSHEAGRDQGHDHQVGPSDRDRDREARETDHRRHTHDRERERHRGHAEEHDRDRDWRDGSSKRGRAGESAREADRNRCLASSTAHRNWHPNF